MWFKCLRPAAPKTPIPMREEQRERIAYMIDKLKNAAHETAAYHTSEGTKLYDQGYREVTPGTWTRGPHTIVLGSKSAPLAPDFASSGRIPHRTRKT